MQSTDQSGVLYKSDCWWVEENLATLICWVYYWIANIAVSLSHPLYIYMHLFSCQYNLLYIYHIDILIDIKWSTSAVHIILTVNPVHILSQFMFASYSYHYEKDFCTLLSFQQCVLLTYLAYMVYRLSITMLCLQCIKVIRTIKKMSW